MPSRAWIAGLLASAFVAGATFGADIDDPYVWLEDIHGAKAVAWAEEQNAAAFKRLKSDSDYAGNYDAVLSVLDATDRIPMGQVYVSYVFNFWQDEAHVRGIWRRASIASYESASPQWETLIDVDELARSESKNWVFKRASCSLDLRRCLIALSLGGGDTVVLREFDPVAKRFMPDGFDLGEAKAEAAYVDADTILFSTDFGKGTLTESGYPRIVKLWHRGEKIADAKIVYQGTTSDVVVSPVVFQLPSGPIALAARSVNYYDTEYYSVLTGEAIKLPLPESADVKTAIGDHLIATLRKEWVQDDGSALAQGSLIAFPLKEFLATRKPLRAVALYSPGPRATVDQVEAGRDAVYAAIFDNVTGSVHAFKPDGTGSWNDTRLDLPGGGSTGIASANPFGPEAYFTYQGFLTPTTLYAGRGDAMPAAIKSLPARFDPSPYRQSQYEAISKDGTRIPYFVVRPRNAQGATPMVLYGYGGFEASQSPFYWTAMGRIWLPKGGSYAVANIRGGGEFGPAWHEAALKTNRQKAFDDFIAVAEDMVFRGLTTPEQLGILGGSNGGLLVGTVAVQRPDLFGAVVCQVPLLDMLRYTKFGAGASWMAEYGDPENPEERAAILSYSPYQNVKPKVKYPPIFFITATSDDRVTPVHARKMAAKMEAQAHDVLFYENTDGGHAAAANHAQQAEMNALSYVFFTQELMRKP